MKSKVDILKDKIEVAIGLLESSDLELGTSLLLEITSSHPSRVQRYARPKNDGLIDYEAVNLAKARSRDPSKIRIM
ncbi:MAG: hypothetical protein EOP48_23185 [Sphingobacteriales bacterium]|nr:MAG: hypothetical protein EOP48_23185 [Sphingobacteriales bacterium]